MIEGKIKLHLVAESSDDVTDELYNQIKSAMKRMIQMYNIGPTATRVTLSALGDRLVTKIPPSPQNLDVVRVEIDKLPKVGGAMVLPLDETLDTDNTVLQHLVFITSKNLSVADTKGYEAIKEAMREKRILFNLVNVLSQEYQDVKEDQTKLDFLIEVIGGENLPGVISQIGENTINGLSK